MQQKIFQMLLNEDEITWQTIILDLVKTQQMNPWDINISQLAELFLERLKLMKETDLMVSGKVLLAAAILLRIKSDKLITDDINDFDRLMQATDTSEDNFYDELESQFHGAGMPAESDKFKLVPRTPQPRKRKVSVYDLVEALNQALEVEERRKIRHERYVDAPKVNTPEKQTDMSVVIKNVYAQVCSFIVKQKKASVKFSELVPSDNKKDKVYTFIPLLHLSNQRKVDLEQESHFTDFDILLREKKAVN